MNLPQPLIACATCLSDPGTAVGEARNSAVLFMAAVVALVFGVIFYSVFSFIRRQRRFAAEAAATHS